ncbi:MAG: antitoxin Xre/MbcA/ParS toxin-binding domain-containing protein [Nakamurella sp.]
MRAKILGDKLRSDIVFDVPQISYSVRTEALANALGGFTRVAELLGVSRSQPTRWKQGSEQPSPESARLLIDLDHVMARAQLVFTPQVARDWLVGANSYLDGARPIDVLQLRGSSEVVDALDAVMQGSYS